VTNGDLVRYVMERSMRNVRRSTGLEAVQYDKQYQDIGLDRTVRAGRRRKGR
jgi:hypothetical protein